MPIQRRTVFAEKGSDGIIRFSDWALVTTNLGTMAEMHIPFQRESSDSADADGVNGAAFDAGDAMYRVDEIIWTDLDRVPTMISGGNGMVLHGGLAVPRTGR